MVFAHLYWIRRDRNGTFETGLWQTQHQSEKAGVYILLWSFSLSSKLVLHYHTVWKANSRIHADLPLYSQVFDDYTSLWEFHGLWEKTCMCRGNSAKVCWVSQSVKTWLVLCDKIVVWKKVYKKRRRRKKPAEKKISVTKQEKRYRKIPVTLDLLCLTKWSSYYLNCCYKIKHSAASSNSHLAIHQSRAVQESRNHVNTWARAMRKAADWRAYKRSCSGLIIYFSFCSGLDIRSCWR